MIASSQTTYNENLIRKEGLRLLPTAVIYGANASGKSNILMSLNVLRAMVISGSLTAKSWDLTNLELYPYIHDNKTRPMTFEIEFIHRGKRFEYKLHILVSTLKKSSRKIVYESLSYIEGTKQPLELFLRSFDRVELNKAKRALDLLQSDADTLELFQKRLSENLDAESLFLSSGFKSIISDEVADDVLDFFKSKLVVISDFTLKTANLSFDLSGALDSETLIKSEELEQFVKRADFGPQTIFWKLDASDDESKRVAKLFSAYQFDDAEVLLPAELMESRGTLKLIDFIVPFLSLFVSGGVLVLDEFDATIHPEIIKGIIALFNNSQINKAGAQLIFTTHNPIYLSNRMFRRDQIRFVEKPKFCSKQSKKTP